VTDSPTFQWWAVGKKHRISYFDVVGRATQGLKDRAVGKAIERLSATYRAGENAFDYASPEGRAAYLWHILPAHVCDVARLLLDAGVVYGRESLTLVGLGSGPGSEVLALLEAVSAEKARGGLAELTRLRALRVEQAKSWDHAFKALLPQASQQVRSRTPDFGEGWTLDAPTGALACDLTQPPLATDVTRALGEADVVIAANLLTEVRPRGTDELPAGLRECLSQAFAALQGDTEVLLLDRAGAPGAAGRLAAAVELARAEFPSADVTGPRDRTTKCGCAFTRRGKAIYEHVNLPTTKDADRPVKNCKTLWYRLRLSREG
jgi:hypothetical protein